MIEEEDFDIDHSIIEMVTEDYEKNDIQISTIDLSEPGIVEISYYDTRHQSDYAQSMSGLRIAIHSEELAEGFLQLTSVARLMIRDAEVEIRDHLNKNVRR